MTEAAKHGESDTKEEAKEEVKEEVKHDEHGKEKEHKNDHDEGHEKKKTTPLGTVVKEVGHGVTPKVSLKTAAKDVGTGIGKVANTLVLKPVTSVSKFIWNRVGTVVSSAWDATGGQVTGEYKEIKKRATAKSEPEAKSEINGPLSAIGKITSTIFNKIGNVLGGTLSYGVSLPGRMTERALTGTENMVAGAIIGRKLGTKNTTAAANDGAHHDVAHTEPTNDNAEKKEAKDHEKHAAA